MRQIITCFLLVGLVLPVTATAHGPSRQKVVKEIQINAPASRVWELMQDFCSISNWDPEVPECSADPGNKPDTIRTIKLGNGAPLREQLIKHQPDRMMMQYMLLEANPDALPVNTLGTTLSVREGDNGGAVVEWKCAFYRSFPGPTPPPELSDEAAIAAVTKLVDAGLAGLKALAEK